MTSAVDARPGRLRRPSHSPLLAVAPSVAVVGLGAGYALVEGLGASIGIGAPVDGVPIGLDAYRRVLDAPTFWESARFSLWIAVASTVLAAAGGTLISWWWISRPGRIRRIDLWLIHLTVSIPHVAWAVALVAAISQSGLVARIGAATGMIDRPDQFPVFLADRAGIGIIAHLATKEMAFVTLVTLPLATRRARTAVVTAATLGASRSQRFRLVFLPAIAPALLPAAAVAFAFALGSYEAPALLGGQRPRTLSVIALDSFRDADLTRRADAFAISTIIGAIALVAAGCCWWFGRRWSRPTATPTAQIVGIR